MAQLLIVDDEPSICWGLQELGASLGHRVDCAASAEQGLEAVRRRRPDVIFLDVRLPGMDGISALPQFQRGAAGEPIVVMTAFGDLATAARAVSARAFDYLTKPFGLEQAERVLARALASEPRSETPSPPHAPPDGLVGDSPAMQEVYKQTALVAATDVCVHLTGETGTGKELFARAIHRYGPRSAGPFVPVNLAALSESLIEAELFGHVAGAFTGAVGPRAGLLAQAAGGTLFLDEIGEAPLAIQAKLLRALEFGEFYPVGSATASHADFRLLTATNRDLAERVAAGDFRSDLFYRLTTFRIALPPLRARAGDVRQLAAHFASQFSARASWPASTLSEEFLRGLETRDWPGNVRELKHAVEYAMVTAQGGRLLPEHLPAPQQLASPQESTPSLRPLVGQWARAALADADTASPIVERFWNEVEPALLAEVLRHHQGQVAPAARALGWHRTTLRKRLERHGLLGDENAADG